MIISQFSFYCNFIYFFFFFFFFVAELMMGEEERNLMQFECGPYSIDTSHKSGSEAFSREG